VVGAQTRGQRPCSSAQTAKRVHMLIRGDAMAQTMSRYLISRFEAHPRVELHTRTEIVGSGRERTPRAGRVADRSHGTGGEAEHSPRVHHDRG